MPTPRHEPTDFNLSPFANGAAPAASKALLLVAPRARPDHVPPPNSLVRWAVLRTLRPAASFRLLCFALLFILGGNAQAQILFADSFNYPDGPIVGAAGSPWVNNYLPTNQANIVAGKLFLTQTEDEAVRVNFTHTTTGSLYARFRVTFTELPTGVGNYFAFFRQSGVDNNRARLWATTNGAAAGKFRLGIRTFQATALSLIEEDLALGVPYTVVMRYNVTNHNSTVWLDPENEAATARHTESAGGSAAIGISHFAFLQTDTFNGGQGMGSLYVDDLAIGRNFYQVWDGARLTQISRLPNQQVNLAGFGVPSTNYLVLAHTNLTTTNWAVLDVIPAAADGSLQFTDIAAPGFSTRFYRLLAQ